MKKLKENILDFYLNYSIATDIALIIIVWFVSKKFPLIEFELSDRSAQLNIISNLIGCCISLAGFMLAAFTIIVTFKSNIKAKGLEDTNNAMEMILASPQYNSIVKVFKNAILEFIICFIVLVCFWASCDNLSIWTLNRLNVAAILSISLSVLRSLFILFSVIQMEEHKR